MRSEAECLPPYYVIWRRAAEIRQGWSTQTRANRRRKAKLLLRRIGLDESLLPPVTPHYAPGDRRYRPTEPLSPEPQFAPGDTPRVSADLFQRARPLRIRPRAR